MSIFRFHFTKAWFNLDDLLFEQSHRVTLSEAKGLSPSAARCFAEFTLERSEGLSMTGRDLSVEPCLSEQIRIILRAV